MSIRDCDNESWHVSKCEGCGHIYVDDGFNEVCGVKIPQWKIVDNPTLCEFHKNNPWCCREKGVLCSQHTAEMCWWSVKQWVESGKPPDWIIEWLNQEP